MDEKDGIEFLLAVEGKKYPIFGTMFHPECQNARVMDKNTSWLVGKVDNYATDAINYYFSQYLN